MNMQTITAMKQYEGKSVEELRMEDYQRGNKGQGQGAPIQLMCEAHSIHNITST